MWNPPQSYYDPPEPPEPCCELGEEGRGHICYDDCLDPCPLDHDEDACLADQAEDAAEAKAERQREDRMEDMRDPTGWL